MQCVKTLEATHGSRQWARQIIVVNRKLHHVSVSISRHAVPLSNWAIASPEITFDPIWSAERVIKFDQRLTFALTNGCVARLRQRLGSSRLLREHSCRAKGQQQNRK